MSFFNQNVNITPQPRPIANPVTYQSGYPFRLKWTHTHTVAAGGETKVYELAQAPIAAIVINQDCLGSGAAATVGNLNGLLTSIKVTDGGELVTPTWSGTELYEYNAAFRGSLPPFQDGTAADNKLAMQSLVIPFGRPLATRHPSPFSVFDPMVGLVPKGIPQIEAVFAADGSNIDTRHVKIGVMYYTYKPAYTKKWTEWSSQTLSTSGAKDWILPQTGQLLEAFMYQTSSYNDTLTADAPTLLKWDITQSGKSIVTDGEMFNMLGAMIDTNAQPDDDYIYVPFVQNTSMDLSLAPRLATDTRFLAYGGVADAFKAAFAKVDPV